MPNFIPRPYKKDPITIRIDVDKLTKIDEFCAKYSTNRSEFINRCIDFAVEHMTDDSKADLNEK